ncbi:Calmodulin-binding transcription activator 3 [Platanthera guangdongensis]|uniref:Calmodulin-binding transcription activator 3 n=1 Tax=Platanthera guangdongensis TaxID=2320717 RepID=A0ABR2MZ66_9ASPA
MVRAKPVVVGRVLSTMAIGAKPARGGWILPGPGKARRDWELSRGARGPEAPLCIMSFIKIHVYLTKFLKTGPDQTGRSDRSDRRPGNYPVRSMYKNRIIHGPPRSKIGKPGGSTGNPGTVAGYPKPGAGSVDVLHCYYAHGEDNESFQRRSYWMLEEYGSKFLLYSCFLLVLMPTCILSDLVY